MGDRGARAALGEVGESLDGAVRRILRGAGCGTSVLPIVFAAEYRFPTRGIRTLRSPSVSVARSTVRAGGSRRRAQRGQRDLVVARDELSIVRGDVGLVADQIERGDGDEDAIAAIDEDHRAA